MRYILNDEGFIEAVSFGCTIECKDKTCTEYTGIVPEGYETLAIWNENANINAYKIVEGNLVYDSEEDARLQSLWASQEADNKNTIVESGSNANGKYTKFADGTLICRGKNSISSIGANSGVTNTIPFPYPFIDNDYDFSIDRYDCGAYWSHIMTQVISRTTTTFAIAYWNNTEYEAGQTNISYIVIGKWK